MSHHHNGLNRPGYRIKQPGVPRRHEGHIAVKARCTRWCSDGLEFYCEGGAKLSVTFALDCCDREVIGWVASPTGYNGDDNRNLMLDSVEKRFGDQLRQRWCSDSATTAAHTLPNRHVFLPGRSVCNRCLHQSAEQWHGMAWHGMAWHGMAESL